MGIKENTFICLLAFKTLSSPPLFSSVHSSSLLANFCAKIEKLNWGHQNKKHVRKKKFKIADAEIERDDPNMEITDDFESVYNVNRCKNSVNILCRVCNKKAGGAHKCFKCKCVVHLIISFKMADSSFVYHQFCIYSYNKK